MKVWNAKRFISLLLVMLMCVSLVPLQVQAATAPTSMKLNATGVTIGVNESYKLVTTLTPAAATSKLTWKTSDSKIATVSTAGVVKAIKTGSVTITVTTANGLSKTCKVTVAKAPTGIKLPAAGVTLGVGQTKTPSVTYSPSGAYNTVTWKSDKTSVATVDAKTGKITAKKIGTATITATTTNKKNATYKVTVKAAPAKIALDKEKVTINAGSSATLKATITPSGAATSKTWSSSKTAVAKVDSSGKVTALKAGTADITVKTHNGKKATCKVTVKAVAPTKLAVDKSSLKLGVNESYKLVTTLTPAYATSKLTWKTSDAKIATVTAAGLVKAVKTGSATITVTTANGLSKTCKVTVQKAPTSVKLPAASKTLTVGQTYKPAVTFSSGATGSVTWKSANTSIATVNSTGTITAKKVGSTTVTVTTYNKLPAKITIDVKAVPQTVKLNTASLIMGVGETKTIAATVSPATALQTVTWSSSNTKYVTVLNGKLTAVARGKATIAATTTNGLKATCAVEVRAAPSGISLNQTSAPLTHSTTLQLTATLKKSTSLGAPDVAGSVTWSSNNTSVATVDANGKVTTKSGGSATITAKSYNGKTASCAITVLVVPTSIKFNKGDFTLGAGSVMDAPATTIAPAKNAVQTKTWKSSDTSVLAVNASTGQLTALKTGKTGKATLTVTTVNGKTASITVTVVPMQDIVDMYNKAANDTKATKERVKMTQSSYMDVEIDLDGTLKRIDSAPVSDIFEGGYGTMKYIGHDLSYFLPIHREVKMSTLTPSYVKYAYYYTDGAAKDVFIGLRDETVESKVDPKEHLTCMRGFAFSQSEYDEFVKEAKAEGGTLQSIKVTYKGVINARINSAGKLDYLIIDEPFIMIIKISILLLATWEVPTTTYYYERIDFDWNV